MKYIETIREGERISGIYLCKQRQSAVTKNGKTYENLILQDKTGTVDAKIWDPNSLGIDEFDALDYIEIMGDVTSFAGAMQLNIKRARKAGEGEYDPADYLPTSENSVDDMQSQLRELINSVKNPYLSQLLKTYEKLGKKADREVVHQYIQHWKIAKDFANYLELYRKYKKDYGLEKIIEGVYTKDTLERLQYAAFDERLSVVNMLIGRLGTCFKDYFLKDRFVTILYEYLKLYRSNLQIDLVVCEARDKYEKLRKEEQMTKQEDHVRKQVLDTLESYEQLTKEEHLDGEAAFERVKELFGNEVAGREELTEHTLAALEHAFDFMEAAFGDSQEMVSFVTELNTNYYSIQFLKENDCDKYYQYNKKLLFDKQQEEILSEMDEIEQDLNTVIK